MDSHDLIKIDHYITPALNINKRISDEQYIRIRKLVTNKHFSMYKEYYEPAYVNSKLLNLGSSNIGVIYNKNIMFMKDYIEIFKNYLEVLKPEKEHLYGFSRGSLFDYIDYNYNDQIMEYFNDIKKRLKEEWEADCLNVTIDNFYEKNMIPLNELKIYMEKEVKNFKNGKV